MGGAIQLETGGNQPLVDVQCKRILQIWQVATVDSEVT